MQMVEVPNVSWIDVGGLENVKRELQEVSYTSANIPKLEILLYANVLSLATVTDGAVSGGASGKV